MNRRCKYFLATAVVLASTVSSFGQIGIGLTADRRKYLRYEPINMKVTLRNYTGNTLVFGLDPKEGSLRFKITRSDHRPVRMMSSDANPAAGLILGTGETKTLNLAINGLFDMQWIGTYRIQAVVRHPRLSNDYISDPVSIDVRGGLVCWRQSVGIPASSSTMRIQPREASLVLFHADVGDIYCLRVEDKQKVYGVVRLGSKVAGGKPECDVDAISSIHVLLLVRPRLYAYRVYDYNLKLRQDRYYILDHSTPHLVRDAEIGRITVKGGRAAVEGVDYRLDRPVLPGTAVPGDASAAKRGAVEPGRATQNTGPTRPALPEKKGSFFRRLFHFGRKG